MSTMFFITTTIGCGRRNTETTKTMKTLRTSSITAWMLLASFIMLGLVVDNTRTVTVTATATPPSTFIVAPVGGQRHEQQARSKTLSSFKCSSNSMLNKRYSMEVPRGGFSLNKTPLSLISTTTTTSSLVVRRMSDNAIVPDANEEQNKEMEQQQQQQQITEEEIKEVTKKAIRFMSISLERMKSDLMKNWGWAVSAGFLTMILGAVAFSMPIFATAIAYETTLVTVACVGMLGIGGFIFGETGKRYKYGISGIFYGTLAYVMKKNPLTSINVMTLWIASLLFGEGLYETLLAIQNQLIDGRSWLFVNGIVSIIASAVLVTNMPATSIIVPGIALATRLISTGSYQFSLGLLGRDLANDKLSK